MAAIKMTFLALLVCAMTMGASARLGPVLPTPVFRYVSLTQYNSSANLTDLYALELKGANNCTATILPGGITGVNANISVTAGWGGIVKVYDFAGYDDYVTYQLCSDNQTTRTLTKPWETGKVVAGANTIPTPDGLLPSDCAVGSFCDSFFHVSLANTSDAQLTVADRQTLFDAFTGQSYGSFEGADSGFITSRFPTKVAADVAVGINFVEPQGAAAYYFYKHGWQTPPGNITKLPIYASISALQTSVTFDIEFVPQRLV